MVGNGGWVERGDNLLKCGYSVFRIISNAGCYRICKSVIYLLLV
jgi:hypothetical protein